MVFRDIETDQDIEQAANVLFLSFQALNNTTWPTINDAKNEVIDCIRKPGVCIGLFNDDILLGWIGMRPMYKVTWELHPLVVNPDEQNRGYGRLLINELENRAKANGIIGLVLGADDESNRTSLSSVSINRENIFSEIRNVKNTKDHPFEFYQKCGYTIIGIIPNANGYKKPDIWMWKDLL